MAFWKQAETIEYSGEVSKTKSIFSLLFLIIICTGMGYLILKLVPYTWDEFTDYEQTGKEIKNHWAIWPLYDIGGKWLVCSDWGLFGGLMMYGGVIFLKQLFKTLTKKNKYYGILDKQKQW